MKKAAFLSTIQKKSDFWFNNSIFLKYGYDFFIIISSDI